MIWSLFLIPININKLNTKYFINNILLLFGKLVNKVKSNDKEFLYQNFKKDFFRILNLKF